MSSSLDVMSVNGEDAVNRVPISYVELRSRMSAEYVRRERQQVTATPSFGGGHPYSFSTTVRSSAVVIYVPSLGREVAGSASAV